MLWVPETLAAFIQEVRSAAHPVSLLLDQGSVSDSRPASKIPFPVSLGPRRPASASGIYRPEFLEPTNVTADRLRDVEALLAESRG